MQIITTTFAFLFLFAIFTYTQMQQLQELKILDSCFSGSLVVQQTELKNKLFGKATRTFKALTNTTNGEDEEIDDDDEEANNSNQKPVDLRTRFLSIFSLIPKPDPSSQPPTNAAAHAMAQTTTAVPPKNTEEATAAMNLLTRLIAVLYEDKPFFRDAKMNDTAIEMLMKTFFTKAETLAKNSPITHKIDLANVIVENEANEDMIYKILKGNNIVKEKWGDKELQSPENYDSLLEYVSLKERKTLMSVYLAPKPLLLALFQDPAIVDKVVEARNGIYKELTKKNQQKANSVGNDENSGDTSTLADSLSERFQLEFTRYLPNDINATWIDFAVSKTKP